MSRTRFAWLCGGMLAVVCALGARSHAASMMSFRLTNQGVQSIGRIDLSVVPAGAIVPPVVATDPVTGVTTTASPLTILGTSTGFEQSQLGVALGTNGDAQVLRLLFGQTQTVDSAGQVTFETILDASGQPVGLFLPGAVLDFSIAVDDAYRDSARLELPLAAGGVVLQTLPVSDVTAGEPDPPGFIRDDLNGPVTQVPEPLACVIWAAPILGGWAWRRRRLAG